MSHDNDMRRQQPAGIAAYRGNGVNITMLCGKCRKPKQQLGAKKLKVRGLRQLVCKQCVVEIGK